MTIVGRALPFALWPGGICAHRHGVSGTEKRLWPSCVRPSVLNHWEPLLGL